MADHDHDIHPPRARPSATIRAIDTIDGAGRRETKVAVFCPACKDWSSVYGTARHAQASVHASRQGRPRPGADADPDHTPLASIMTRHVVCVRPEIAIETVAQIMLDEGIGSVPVVDRADRLIGIVTKTDILRAGWEGAAWELTDDGDEPRASGFHTEPLPRAVVGEVMTPFVFTLPTDAPIARAAALMAHEGIHRLAVVSHDGTVVGVVTSSDVIRWVAQRAGYVVPDGRRATVGTAHESAGSADGVVPAVAGGSRRIMIVDDDADLLSTYESALTDEGYDVITARNGAEAVARLAEGQPSVIFLDLRMPVMDGWSFHARLARDPSTATIPIVLMSGNGDLRGEVKKLGVRGYLAKPVPLGRLLTTAEQYCTAA